MSSEKRKEIAYWFFLIVGLVGVVWFTIQFALTYQYSFWEWLGIISSFSIFIFKPMILLDVFEAIKNKFLK